MTVEPSEISLDAVTAALTELPEISERAGLQWGLRYATVVDATRPTGRYDGDTTNTSVPLISLIGPLVAGTRVAVLFIPPGGNYVIAAPGGSFSAARLVYAVETAAPGGTTDTTVGAAELNLSRLTMSNVSLVSGELYRLDLQIITTRSVAANEFEFILREVTALTGTALGSAFAWGVSTTAGQYVRASIYWTSTFTGPRNLFISVQRVSGAGTITIFYESFGVAARTHAALYWVGGGSVLRRITS